MSYDQDRLEAATWWEATKGKELTDDVPDLIGPPPPKDAVTKMEYMLYSSSCFETSDKKKEEAKFRTITESKDVSAFLEC